ncbi:MAG TPA: hypothetical protein VHD33_02945 [Legionellaceae bacterium]|nr:hypothetical protein [Legionellaceae bacterium]
MKLAPNDLAKVERQLGSKILEFPSYLETYAQELNKEFLEGEDPKKPFTIFDYELNTGRALFV